MRWCKREMTPLQRRSMQKLGGLMGVMAGMSVVGRSWTGAEHAPATVAAVSVLLVLPTLAAILVVARYLAAEPDEFIRTLAMRSLLWGLAITMLGDAVVGALMQMYGGHLSMGLLNADLLFVGTGLAFRWQQRSYR